MNACAKLNHSFSVYRAVRGGCPHVKRLVNRISAGRSFTNVTYSGGAEAYDGQGGFCGSGGSSKINPVNIRVCVDQVVAHDEDITTLARMMKAVKAIEASSKGSKELTVEGSVEDIVTKPAFQKSLERLQYKSEPVW
eukprot:CAMPEP_0116056608 /NCGR_PEP_ID=MMETSP0322-20121206/4119_1 /TAXON_ID=163516 /ORGANISM="Leptocylindrus danicus var. apora, Strain B651" /LENGTH=136 /DNA_ID=CAMNT_0003540465 /DNA_START=1737 /DNA_END=2144 /DNA_ORIENTATION=-